MKSKKPVRTPGKTPGRRSKGEHPGSANLRPPWKPGECPNPGGRPKKLPITSRYLKQLETVLPDEVRLALRLKRGATMGDAIALGMARQAMNGNVKAASEITDRTEGKAPQRLELPGGEGNEIKIRVVYEDSEGEKQQRSWSQSSKPDKQDLSRS